MSEVITKRADTACPYDEDGLRDDGNRLNLDQRAAR